MIKLIPLENGQALKELCAHYQIAYTPSVHAYVNAPESVRAQCVFSLDTYRVSLLAIDFEKGDPLLPEMLIRAVGAYAANRSGYLFEIGQDIAKNIIPTLETLRFEKTETGYIGKVPKILQGSCHCHKS